MSEVDIPKDRPQSRGSFHMYDANYLNKFKKKLALHVSMALRLKLAQGAGSIQL